MKTVIKVLRLMFSRFLEGGYRSYYLPSIEWIYGVGLCQ